MVLEQYSTAVLNIEIAVEYCPWSGVRGAREARGWYELGKVRTVVQVG